MGWAQEGGFFRSHGGRKLPKCAWVTQGQWKPLNGLESGDVLFWEGRETAEEWEGLTAQGWLCGALHSWREVTAGTERRARVWGEEPQENPVCGLAAWLSRGRGDSDQTRGLAAEGRPGVEKGSGRAGLPWQVGQQCPDGVSGWLQPRGSQGRRLQFTKPPRQVHRLQGSRGSGKSWLLR